MKLRALGYPSLLFTIASFVAPIAVWSKLPDPYPTHWNFRGVIDGWTPKPWGPLILPIALAGTVLLMAIVARTQKEKRTRRMIRLFSGITSAALFAIEMVTMLAAMGHRVDVGAAISIIVGVLFVALGNYFGKLPRNPIAGIRTPWTLKSDEVWFRTHRFGGKLFVLGGLATIAGALFGVGNVVLLVAILFATIASVTYSYFADQALKRGR